MFVYLLHFTEPYRHAGHYLGWTGRSDLESRLDEHERGIGARLTNVVRDAGHTWQLARVWRGDRALERKLKQHRGRHCPVCRPSLLDGWDAPHRRPQNIAADLPWSVQQLAGPWQVYADPQCSLCHGAPVARRHRTMPLCAECAGEFERLAAMTADERRAEEASVNAYVGGDL